MIDRILNRLLNWLDWPWRIVPDACPLPGGCEE